MKASKAQSFLVANTMMQPFSRHQAFASKFLLMHHENKTTKQQH